LKAKKNAKKPPIAKPGGRNNDDIAFLSPGKSEGTRRNAPSSTTLSRYLKSEEIHTKHHLHSNTHNEKTGTALLLSRNSQPSRFGGSQSLSYVHNIVEAQRSKFDLQTEEEAEPNDIAIQNLKIRQALENFEKNMNEDHSKIKFQSIAKIKHLEFPPSSSVKQLTKKKTKEEELILPMINGRFSHPRDEPESVKYWRKNKNPTAKGFQRLQLSDLYKEYIKNKHR